MFVIWWKNKAFPVLTHGRREPVRNKLILLTTRPAVHFIYYRIVTGAKDFSSLNIQARTFEISFHTLIYILPFLSSHLTTLLSISNSGLKDARYLSVPGILVSFNYHNYRPTSAETSLATI